MTFNYFNQPLMFLNYNFLNFGPKQLSAYIVLCFVLDLYGEVITKANLYVGLLRRGIQKLVEFTFQPFNFMQNPIKYRHLNPKYKKTQASSVVTVSAFEIFVNSVD
jgi:NADH:ubiquinone oxidoreductase subunit D